MPFTELFGITALPLQRHHQRSLPPCLPHSPLIVFRAHPTLSPLFGSLLFGLGPAPLPFHHTSLDVIDAMEHVLLAFVRWQDAPTNESSSLYDRGPGSAASLGIPTRLKDLIRCYPPCSRNRPPAQGSKRGFSLRAGLTRCGSSARMYTPDLVRSAASWAERPPSCVMPPRMYLYNLAIGNELPRPPSSRRCVMQTVLRSA